MPDAPAKPAFPYKTQPFGPYQRDILIRSAPLPGAYLSMEQGTGKTWVAIVTAASLFLKKKIDGMVVIAPNGVHTGWALEQLPLHMPDVVPWVAHIWNSGAERAVLNRGRRRELGSVQLRETNALWHLIQDKSKFPILCINSEALPVALCFKWVNTMLINRRCMVVVDEAGDFTTPSAVRTRKLMRLRHLAPYRRVLEGVPVGTEPFELYAPYRFLDPKILGYENYGQMKEAHADWETIARGGAVIRDEAGNRIGGGREFKVVKTDPKTGKKAWKNLDVLKQKIAPVTFRATKAEALPFLPPKLFHKRYFSLTAEQWRLTNELRENLIADLSEGGTVSAANVLTQYLRFQQIACGYVPPDVIYGEEEVQPLSIIPGPNPRLEACVSELVRYGGSPTIIWTRFHFDIDILQDRLRSEGFSVVTYDGRTSSAGREEAKARFQSGKVNVFLGNPAAGGRGLNLQKAEQEIFYANYFGLRRRLQAEDRGHRIGTRTDINVRVCDLVGAYSIDNVIVRALRNNQEVADAITGDPAKDWV